MSAPGSPSDAPAPRHHPLLILAAIRLAPLFLAVTGGDQARAQAYAREAIRTLHPDSVPEFFLAAQAIGFSIAAITALGESAAPDLPEKQADRLRSQADRLGRSAARCTKALASQSPEQRPRQPTPHHPPRPQPDAQAPTRAAWAAAMEEVAAELAQDHEQYAVLQATALRGAAQTLRQPQPPHHAPPR